jgi:O-antigen ligase
MLAGRGLLAAEPRRDVDTSPRQWAVAAALFGLLLVDGVREGGFWQADACVAGVAALVLLVAASVLDPLDRRSAAVVLGAILLAAWWALRSATSSSLETVLPLGASLLAFAAAFAAVRPLRGAVRQHAGVAIAGAGAAGALVGFTGLIGRWYPEAIPAQGLWRLATTLTYADAAGLALAVCLLVALGTERSPLVGRVAVCLCAGGLLATQSRGAYVAFACACAFVPWRRYEQLAVPVAAGCGLGVAAIASSPRAGPVPWLGAVLVAAVGVAALPHSVDVRALWARPAGRGVTALGLGAVLAGAALAARHEIGLRALAPSDRDRSVEWAAALHQWGSAPLFGVGPDRALVFHSADGTLAHFAHNEYLQIVADAGVVGLLLLAATVFAVVRVVRRVDALSSAACGALVCVGVAGAFDFDWHLPVTALLAGACVGLATERRPTGPDCSGDGEHPLERHLCPLGGVGVHDDLVADVSVDEPFEDPGEVGRVDARHGRARADQRVEADDGLVG